MLNKFDRAGFFPFTPIKWIEKWKHTHTIASGLYEEVKQSTRARVRGEEQKMCQSNIIFMRVFVCVCVLVMHFAFHSEYLRFCTFPQKHKTK